MMQRPSTRKTQVYSYVTNSSFLKSLEFLKVLEVQNQESFAFPFVISIPLIKTLFSQQRDDDDEKCQWEKKLKNQISILNDNKQFYNI